MNTLLQSMIGFSSGYDEVLPCMLKETADEIAEPLKIIFEQSLLEG